MKNNIKKSLATSSFYASVLIGCIISVIFYFTLLAACSKQQAVSRLDQPGGSGGDINKQHENIPQSVGEFSHTNLSTAQNIRDRAFKLKNELLTNMDESLVWLKDRFNACPYGSFEKAFLKLHQDFLGIMGQLTGLETILRVESDISNDNALHVAYLMPLLHTYKYAISEHENQPLSLLYAHNDRLITQFSANNPVNLPEHMLELMLKAMEKVKEKTDRSPGSEDSNSSNALGHLQDFKQDVDKLNCCITDAEKVVGKLFDLLHTFESNSKSVCGEVESSIRHDNIFTGDAPLEADYIKFEESSRAKCSSFGRTVLEYCINYGGQLSRQDERSLQESKKEMCNAEDIFTDSYIAIQAFFQRTQTELGLLLNLVPELEDLLKIIEEIDLNCNALHICAAQRFGHVSLLLQDLTSYEERVQNIRKNETLNKQSKAIELLSVATKELAEKLKKSKNSSKVEDASLFAVEQEEEPSTSSAAVASTSGFVIPGPSADLSASARSIKAINHDLDLVHETLLSGENPEVEKQQKDLLEELSSAQGKRIESTSRELGQAKSLKRAAEASSSTPTKPVPKQSKRGDPN